VKLADSGFPVLRFDYFGAGDSCGDSLEGRMDQWLLDVSQAIDELKSRAGVEEVCLIGLRLGASLALLNATQQAAVKRLVLWDPVLKGKAYLDGLISLSEELLRFRPKPRKNERPEWPKDIIGFPMTQELYDDINGIDLISKLEMSAKNILIVETEKDGSQSGLKRALEDAGACVDLQHVDGPQIWEPTVDGSVQVPAAVLQTVTAWMNRIAT
jgi:esterase/lipase